MAELAIQSIGPAGLNPTYVGASGSGDTFANDGRTFIRAKNGHASTQSVIVTALYPCNHGFTHSVTVAVSAGGERDIGPFARDRFGDPVSVTYSQVTLLTIAALRIPED